MTPLEVLSAHGDPHLVSLFVPRLRVDSETGCWLWIGSTNDHGYGRFTYSLDGRKKAEGAHRFAYRSANGNVPRILDHIVCDTRNCANPSHVCPSTIRENNLRSSCVSSINLSKTHCPQEHEYNNENTYFTRKGDRQCRVCNRLRMREARRHVYSATEN